MQRCTHEHSEKSSRVPDVRCFRADSPFSRSGIYGRVALLRDLNRAQCHLRRGDPKGALSYAARALEVLPDAPEVKGTMESIKAAIR